MESLGKFGRKEGERKEKGREREKEENWGKKGKRERQEKNGKKKPESRRRKIAKGEEENFKETEGERCENEQRTLFSPFFFQPLKICFRGTKKEIFFRGKHFTPGKNFGNVTLPPLKNIPLTILYNHRHLL